LNSFAGFNPAFLESENSSSVPHSFDSTWKRHWIDFVSNVHLNTRTRYHISLIWQVFSQGRRLLTDLISRGAKIRPRPLNTRRSEAVTVSLFIPPAFHHPHPRAFCTLPSFARIKKPRWQPVELDDRHLRSHGKIGDCEQSTWLQDQHWLNNLKSFCDCIAN